MENLTLYVKGTTPTEMDDVWDDTVLNNAYDKALKIANEEVAKRIAMETNSGTASKIKSGKGKEKSKRDSPKSTKPIVWREGMPCRAIYEGDGLEYEAFLMNFVNDEECVVKFLGYENFETVLISSLKPTLGNEARLRQMDEAAGERADDGFESQANSESVDLYSDEPSSPEPIAMPVTTNKKKKSSKSNKKNQGPASHFGDLPNIPMPNMNMFRHLGGAETPLPPPPPLLSVSGSEAEQQAISDMLLSWYMTGYYTGLYQGMKRQNRQSRRYQ